MQTTEFHTSPILLKQPSSPVVSKTAARRLATMQTLAEINEAQPTEKLFLEKFHQI